MKQDKKLYVIKFDNDLYWCGLNTVDKQIRKAKVYNSIKYATETAENILNHKKDLTYNTNIKNIKSYKLVEIEIIEKESISN